MIHPKLEQMLQHAECTEIVQGIIAQFQLLSNGNKSIPKLKDILDKLLILQSLWEYIDRSQISPQCAYSILLSKHRVITRLEQLHKILQGYEVQLPEVLTLSEDDIRTTRPMIKGSWVTEQVDSPKIVRIWHELCVVVLIAKLAHAVQEYWNGNGSLDAVRRLACGTQEYMMENIGQDDDNDSIRQEFTKALIAYRDYWICESSTSKKRTVVTKGAGSHVHDQQDMRTVFAGLSESLRDDIMAAVQNMSHHGDLAEAIYVSPCEPGKETFITVKFCPRPEYTISKLKDLLDCRNKISNSIRHKSLLPEQKYLSAPEMRQLLLPLCAPYDDTILRKWPNPQLPEEQEPISFKRIMGNGDGDELSAEKEEQDILEQEQIAGSDDDDVDWQNIRITEATVVQIAHKAE